MRGARVNLASKRVTVEWNDGALEPPVILDRLDALGYPAYPFASETVDSVELQAEKRLLRCLGVAAFGSMNVMLLSVSLWAGADTDPNSATRDLFHWLSALVALPCAAYAAQPFFESAAGAARPLDQHGRADLARRHARARPLGLPDARPSSSSPISTAR